MAGATERELALALDLGGTRFRVGLVHANGQVVYRRSYSTQAEQGPERVLERITQALRDCQAQVPDDHFVRGIGVGAPGPIDPWTGVIASAPNMPGWIHVPIKTTLERAFGIHTVAGNDANLAALGEARFGAARGHANVVFLTVSTGVGSGILVEGRLLLGARGLASEAGHMTVQVDGPTCKCGNRGCLEALASGTAIAARARELLRSGRPSILSAQAELLTAQLVSAAALQGDELAMQVLTTAARALGQGLVSLVHLFNPSIVILGGGVSNSGDLWWDEVRQVIDELAMSAFHRELRLVAAALGDDMGLLGAAAAVFDEQAASGRP